MTRARRTALVLALVLLVGAAGAWLLTRGSSGGAVEGVGPRPSPRWDASDLRQPPPPVLVGRSDGGSTPPPPPVAQEAEALRLRFVVAGTDSPVPEAEWQVRNDHLRANAAGGWTFVSSGVLFEGRADRAGRAVVPSDAVAAWREHELFAKHPLFRVVILDGTRAAQDGAVTIPLEVRGCAIRRYAGFVGDRTGRAIPGALLDFGGGLEWWARADDHGRFDVSLPVDPDEETWTVVVVAPRFEAVRRELPIEGATDLEFRLVEDHGQAALRLRILERDGSPAGGAWVRVVLPEWGERLASAAFETYAALGAWFPVEGEADADGRFVLHGLPEGTVQVRAWLDGDVALTSCVVRRPETTADVPLERGRTLTGDVQVACVGRCGYEAHRVGWSVTTVTTRPISWLPLGRRPGPVSAFIVRGVPQEELQINFYVPGHPRVVVALPAGPTGSDAPLSLGRIEIPPGRYVEGTVLLDDGTPLREGYVRIECRDVPTVGDWTHEGRFRAWGVWDPTGVKVSRMRDRPEVDVTASLDLDADRWEVRLPAAPR